MRLAILSDIHANLPALEAVLADDRRRRRRRDLVPRRRRRLRRRARRVRRARSRALLRSAWSATTTSPCSASSTSRPSPRPRPPPCAGPGRRSSPETLEFLARPRAGRREPRGGALPRLAPRPGLGVRALARPGGRVHPRPGDAGEPRRPLARRALLRRSRRRAPTAEAGRRARRAGRGRHQPRARRGPLADQPGQRRPAARRRSAGRLARARHRRVGGDLPPGRLRHRPGRRGDRGGRAARAPRPSGSTSGQ